MSSLARILSRPTAKPYRTGDLESSEKPHVNEQGQIDFSPDDIENPHNWSASRRWYVTFASVMLVVNATFASSSPSGCFPVSSLPFSIHFVERVLICFFITEYRRGVWGLRGGCGTHHHFVSSRLLRRAFGFCALIRGKCLVSKMLRSDHRHEFQFYGRRWVFYSTFIAYVAFNFLCAFAPNFGSLLVGRFLTGTFVSAPLSNAPGVLADLWGPVERGNAMAAFSCMVWVGPALGPVVSVLPLSFWAMTI